HTLSRCFFFLSSPCAHPTLHSFPHDALPIYAGLTLGTQRSNVAVNARDGAYSAADQAPVLVTQNWEPNDSPGSAPTIDKNTLIRSEEHTSELQSLAYLVCRLLLEKKNQATSSTRTPCIVYLPMPPYVDNSVRPASLPIPCPHC